MGNKSSSALESSNNNNNEPNGNKRQLKKEVSSLMQAIETAQVTKKLHICSGLNRFPDEALEHCHQLKELKIKYISVRAVPESISILQHLQVLLLQRCQVCNIQYYIKPYQAST